MQFVSLTCHRDRLQDNTAGGQQHDKGQHSNQTQKHQPFTAPAETQVLATVLPCLPTLANNT